ncbi:MAG: small-conductance mechanosensitive channel [Gammaproteobacteria bacterium]|jgi:small-conductance mechanosensitive channel
MQDSWPYFAELLGGTYLLPIASTLIVMAVGLIVARLGSLAAKRVVATYVDNHRSMIVHKISYYSILALFLVTALHQIGFNLSVLLGAAGIASVAIGFASQTSASNLISGLFLIGEESFRIGDVIRIGDTTGEVLSIDLLSVKLRTFDNLFVRLPNEQLIKSQVTNLTRFPIRRYDLLLGVAYKEDLTRVREVLMLVAERNPACLEEPKPLFIFQGFDDSSQSVQFSVWAARDNYLELRNSMAEEIKEAFDEAEIEIPFPHRTLYVGSATEPFPVRICDAVPSRTP